VILGIISTIALPKVGNVIQDSRDKATVNEAINIIHAAKLAYIGDNEVFNKENSIKVSDLITLGYIQVDGYDGEVVIKDSEG
jgi:type II secretory pathway pseudopilin PulG